MALSWIFVGIQKNSRFFLEANSLRGLIRTSWPIFSKLILTPSMATMQTVVRSMVEKEKKKKVREKKINQNRKSGNEIGKN
jgi:hypothetical protein